MEILKLTNTEYEGKTIRVCTLPDGRKAASIHDIMAIATGIKNFRDAYMDLKKRFPEVSEVTGNSDDFQQHKFSRSCSELDSIFPFVFLFKKHFKDVTYVLVILRQFPKGPMPEFTNESCLSSNCSS